MEYELVTDDFVFGLVHSNTSNSISRESARIVTVLSQPAGPVNKHTLLTQDILHL